MVAIAFLLVAACAALFVRVIVRRRGGASFISDYVWEKSKVIEKLVNGASEAEWTVALVEADKLLDYILKGNHFPGSTMGDRLRVAGYKFPEIRGIWPAHKLRNRLVHEHHVSLTKGQARAMWRKYRAAYKMLLRSR